MIPDLYVIVTGESSSRIRRLVSRDAKNENSVSQGESSVLPRIKRKPLDVLQRCGTHFSTFSSSAVATLASIICVKKTENVNVQ